MLYRKHACPVHTVSSAVCSAAPLHPASANAALRMQAYASGFDSTSQYEDFYTNQVSPFPATTLLLGVETDGAPNRGQTGSDIAATFQVGLLP